MNIGMPAALFLAIGLAACGDVDPSKAERIRKEARPEVIAEADGVKLWIVYDRVTGRYVYFTSRGDAQWQASCGKNCSRPIQVPAP